MINQQGEQMSKLTFSDGITIDISGTLRIIRKIDGYYVVGRGMSCPVSSIKEAHEVIEMLESTYEITMNKDKDNK
jgi:hypothetical protein